MKVSVSEAKGLLTELVRRAEAGEDVILTRRGREVARLTPLDATGRVESRRAIMDQARAAAAAKASEGPDAARSQDFLYDERGTPA